jgi:hypothetical protein
MSSLGLALLLAFVLFLGNAAALVIEVGLDELPNGKCYCPLEDTSFCGDLFRHGGGSWPAKTLRWWLMPRHVEGVQLTLLYAVQ